MFWTLAGNLLCNLIGLFQLKYFSSWILASLYCGRLPIEAAASILPLPLPNLLLGTWGSQARIIIIIRLFVLQSQFALHWKIKLAQKGQFRVERSQTVIHCTKRIYLQPPPLSDPNTFFTQGSILKCRCLKLELSLSFKMSVIRVSADYKEWNSCCTPLSRSPCVDVLL